MIKEKEQSANNLAKKSKLQSIIQGTLFKWICYDGNFQDQEFKSHLNITNRLCFHILRIYDWFEKSDKSKTRKIEMYIPSKPWASRSRRWDPTRKPKHEQPKSIQTKKKDSMNSRKKQNSTSQNTDREIDRRERERDWLPEQECWYRSKVLEVAPLISRIKP